MLGITLQPKYLDFFGGVNMAVTMSDVSRLVDQDYGLDPYLDTKEIDKNLRYDDWATAKQHLEYMLRIIWPLLYSYRQIVVGQRAMTTYAGLGLIAAGDRDLDHLGAGHILYEDFPGKGKTLLAGVPAYVLGGTFSRFQGVPDSLPADYLGYQYPDYDKDGKKTFKFERGPAFADIQLIDEVNRNHPRTLSALLQVFGEGKITRYGTTYKVNPFGLFTDNPIEVEGEGTYSIPEALLDRIMFKITGEWFIAKQFAEIDERTSHFDKLRGQLKQVCAIGIIHEIREFFLKNIYIDPELREKRMGRFAEITNDPHRFGYLKSLSDEPIIRSGLWGRGFVHWVGASKALAAFRYRSFVTPDDALKVLLPVLRHRIVFAKGIIAGLSRKLKLDKNETIDFTLNQLIREAW